MHDTPNHIDELIASYLSGEATLEEVAIVDRWREADGDNQKYFEHLRLIFERAARTGSAISFDTDQAWERLRENLAKGKSVPMRRHKRSTLLLKIAASMILCVVAGIFAYRNLATGNIQSTEVLAGAETRLDTLPDGTAVFLNRHSNIYYKFDRRSDSHTAALQGEAYFDIKRDDSETFIVTAGETLIKDIGTSFNVTAYPEANTIEVVVDEGEVQFYRSDHPGVNIRAGERGIYDRVSRTFTISAPDPNATAYKTRSFTFSNRRLESVVQSLNNVYDTSIHIDENLRGCKLTVAFQGERIEEIAAVIAETLGLSVAREGDMIRLHGEGCGEAPAE